MTESKFVRRPDIHLFAMNGILFSIAIGVTIFALIFFVATTTEISKKQKPKGLEKNKEVARRGGFAAKKARSEIEKQTGQSVITSKNAKPLKSKKINTLTNGSQQR